MAKRSSRGWTIALAMVVSGAVGAETDQPTLSIRVLATEVALKIASGAHAECTRRGYKVAAAVVGRDGQLLAFVRNPLAGPHTVAVSQQKAYAAATFQTATSAMGEMRDLAFAPGVMLAVGGVPIDIGGHFYGGVAVSGADPQVDEVCSLAGIETVRELLEFAD